MMGFFFCILVIEDSLDEVKPLTYNEGEHVSENSREIDKRSLEYGRRRKNDIHERRSRIPDPESL